MNYRIEKDSMGDVQVPAQAYYGAQTQRAVELLGGDGFHKDKPVHPNDHANMGQSTNDIFPTAIHVAVALEIQRVLVPALQRLHEVLAQKANEWDKIIKIGRTHLADATPL